MNTAQREAAVLEMCARYEKEGKLRPGRVRLSKKLGMPEGTVEDIIRRLVDRGELKGRDRGDSSVEGDPITEAPFSVPELADPERTIEELLVDRKSEFRRLQKAEAARTLIPVKVNLEGAIGIVHMGDPHIDDPGADIAALEHHLRVINRTEGMFASNVGDSNNNWARRLSHLWADQTTRATEAWMLVEWMVGSTDWIYWIVGNHGMWSGPGNPLKWIKRLSQRKMAAMGEWGARLSLNFPNGKSVRVNARHDWPGRSMWNEVHGPSKAFKMGWIDHLLVCGHTHASGYCQLKDPSSGLIGHAIRVAGYEVCDAFRTQEMGLPNQNISPAYVTIIDPRWEDDDPRLITVLADVDEAADYLRWKRGQN